MQCKCSANAVQLSAICQDLYLPRPICTQPAGLQKYLHYPNESWHVRLWFDKISFISDHINNDFFRGDFFFDLLCSCMRWPHMRMGISWTLMKEFSLSLSPHNHRKCDFFNMLTFWKTYWSHIQIFQQQQKSIWLSTCISSKICVTFTTLEIHLCNLVANTMQLLPITNKHACDFQYRHFLQFLGHIYHIKKFFLQLCAQATVKGLVPVTKELCPLPTYMHCSAYAA